MIRFLLRVVALLAVIGVLVYLSLIFLNLVQGVPVLVRHHSISLAYLGTSLGISSLAYMLRKYNKITWGKLRWWLDAHIMVGAISLVMVILHSEYKFAALIPSLNTLLSLIIGVSGFFGWHLYLTSVRALMVEIKYLEEAEQYLLAKMASSAFRFWRFIHIQASLAAMVLTLVHVIALVVYRGRY
jgi:hypothetical protein